MFGAVRSEPETPDQRAQAALVAADVAGWAELRDAEAAELRDLDRRPPWCPACGVHLLDLERERGEAARCPVCLDRAGSPAARRLRDRVRETTRRLALGLDLPPELLGAPGDGPGDALADRFTRVASLPPGLRGSARLR